MAVNSSNNGSAIAAGELVKADFIMSTQPWIAALYYLRNTARTWLYPPPAAIASEGWTYIFATSGCQYAAFGLATLGVGIAVYHIWAPQRKNVHRAT